MNLKVGLIVIMNCIVNQKERKYLILHLNGSERKFFLLIFFISKNIFISLHTNCIYFFQINFLSYPIMSTENKPQSQPLREDQVQNNAGMKKSFYCILIYKIFCLFFKEALVGLWMICNVFDVFFVWVLKVEHIIKVKKNLVLKMLQAILKLIENGRGTEVVETIKTYSIEGRTSKQNPIMFALALCAKSTDLPTKQAAYASLSEICRIPTHLFM